MCLVTCFVCDIISRRVLSVEREVVCACACVRASTCLFQLQKVVLTWLLVTVAGVHVSWRPCLAVRSWWSKLFGRSQSNKTCIWSRSRPYQRRRLNSSHPYSSGRIVIFNLLKPNDIYICHTAALTSRHYILNIYSTNIHTEYFKHAA